MQDPPRPKPRADRRRECNTALEGLPTGGWCPDFWAGRQNGGLADRDRNGVSAVWLPRGCCHLFA
ncbi:hypothetical protein CKO32_07675 [Afifella marina DSM 2698]|nr:hypothetical protein [Afifella marina DSM 2698]MBK5917313.1 hypothetical protein [Afifella marina]RAI18037.1 hypothetical protein CH311_16320 [Afifella marina DSM 2698]